MSAKTNLIAGEVCFCPSALVLNWGISPKDPGHWRCPGHAGPRSLHQKFLVPCSSNIAAFWQDDTLWFGLPFSASSWVHFCIHFGFFSGLLRSCHSPALQVPDSPPAFHCLSFVSSPCWRCPAGSLSSHISSQEQFWQVDLDEYHFFLYKERLKKAHLLNFL